MHLKTHSGWWQLDADCSWCIYAFSEASDLRRHLKMHTGEKSNKCNLCDYACSQHGNFRNHLKHTAEKSQTNATSGILHLFRQAIWERIWKFTVQMQPMWFYTYQGRRFKESFENTTTPLKPFQHILIVICVVNTRFLTTFWENT